jgi:hypothetical protein
MHRTTAKDGNGDTLTIWEHTYPNGETYLAVELGDCEDENLFCLAFCRAEQRMMERGEL